LDVHPGMDARILVGMNLRRYRNLAQISQEDLADLAGIDRTYVSGVERGIRNPTVTVLQSLAEALKIDTAALLEKPEIPTLSGKRPPLKT
jgi:transcriptional regulator with XRE-family HTH domain